MGSPAGSSLHEEGVLPILDARVSEALRFMEANLHDCSWGIADIAAQAGLSRSGFSLLLRVEIGSSPWQMITRMRMQLAAELLSTQRPLPLKEVAARTGFPRPDVFARAFREWYGMTPSEFRRAGDTFATSRKVVSEAGCDKSQTNSTNCKPFGTCRRSVGV